MNQQRHYPVLDGVRGLAISMVLVFHCLSISGSDILSTTTQGIVRAGWTGVDLFFVLSGFLITGILLDTAERPSYFTNFYARRSLRIFPLYFFTLLTFFVFLPWILITFAPSNRLASRFQLLREDQWWYWTYLQNWLYVRLGRFPDAGHLSHFWSLAIEEQFYLIWPWLVWRSSRTRLIKICAASIVICPCIRWWLIATNDEWVPPYVATITRLDTLCMGAILAVLVRRGNFSAMRRTWNILSTRLFFGGAILLVIADRFVPMLDVSNVPSQTYRYSLIGLIAAAFLTAAITAPPASWLHRSLTSTPLRWMGTYSYGIYVIHWPMRHFIAKLTMAPPRFQGLCVFIVSVSLTLLLAVISMTFLERPFLSLKKVFPRGDEGTISQFDEPRPQVSTSAGVEVELLKS